MPAYNLERFKEAQTRSYATALSELRAGRKRSHWIWYIFPQVDGLGFSPTARYYAITDLDEAKAYLADPTLGARLLECTRALLDQQNRNPHAVMGPPDDLKLRSSMTLFEAAGKGDARWQPFSAVLDEFYGGERDAATLEILGKCV